MKIVLTGLLTIAVLVTLHIPMSKKRKGLILAMYALCMIAFFVVYNYRTLDHILIFDQPRSQTLYQPRFLQDGEYTDAFLDEFLKNKTVATPNDAWDISLENPDWPRLYAYYHAYNMWDYLEANNATIVKDDSLNTVVLSDSQKALFTDLGLANDLMRYTFPYTKYADKYGNGYFHYWYYSTYINTSHVYLCTDSLADADELVMIWETEDDEATENYYIASKEAFKSVVR